MYNFNDNNYYYHHYISKTNSQEETGGTKITLDKVKRDQSYKVVSMPDEMVKAQAIMFGISDGETITCE